jgi:hypothetical protein
MILGFGSAAYADTLLHNIQGYSSSDRGIQSFSVLIFDDNGRVLATGDDQLRADYPDATLLNGNAKTVLPGLTDAHGHVYGLGILKSNVDLAGSPSLAHAVSKIEAYASANANMKWITGRGWNQVLWPVKEFPSAKDIDAVVGTLAGRTAKRCSWQGLPMTPPTRSVEKFFETTMVMRLASSSTGRWISSVRKFLSPTGLRYETPLFWLPMPSWPKA